jgi:hypothetical protein
MEETDLTWRKSGYSSNGGTNCVEAADHAVWAWADADAAGTRTAVWRRIAQRDPDLGGRDTGCGGRDQH